jgi:hypothetical protein
MIPRSPLTDDRYPTTVRDQKFFMMGWQAGEPDGPPEAETKRHYRRKQHLQDLSDIAESGGAPRLATAWETEVQSVPMFFARIVNTEGPRTQAAEQGRRERPGAKGQRYCSNRISNPWNFPPTKDDFPSRLAGAETESSSSSE